MTNHLPHNENGLPVELEAWLNEQPKEEAKELEDVWTLAAHAQHFDIPSEPDEQRFDRMRAEVLQSAARSEQTSTRFHVSLRLVKMHTLKIAASLVLLVLAGSLWWTRPISYKAPAGDQMNVQLSDGSTVSLNSGSRLVHNRSFGSNNRRVQLNGEAFFDVMHGDTPFIVETFNGSVTVLGTRFNVRAWDSDYEPETVVALERGSVLLESRSQDATPVVLEPGQVSRILGKEAPTAPVLDNVEQRTSWRSGGLYFNDRPVGAVLDEIKRRYDVQVDISPVSLRQERITLVTSGEQGAESVLTVVARVRGYTLRETNGVFSLTMREHE